MEEQPKYTTIIHKIRINLDLSCNEYCVADIVYHLSNNPESKIRGWCYAAKEKIGEYLGLHKKTIHEIIEKLLHKGLIEKDTETKWLKTTNKWYQSVIVEKIKFNSNERLLTVTKGYSGQTQKVTPHSNERLHNNNNDSNNDNKTAKVNFLDDDELRRKESDRIAKLCQR